MQAAGDFGQEVLELDAVTVTARLRSEESIRVPISMAIVDGSSLEAEGRSSLGRLDSRVANLQLGDLNGTPVLFMRGVGGGGRQVAFEPRAGIYLDGVFMNVPPLTDALLLDLERVEVLRGPQGSLFGQNLVSGAVSLVTREPGDVFSVQSLARVDARGEQRFGLAVDMPLVQDSLLFRASGHLAQARGETINLQAGNRLDAYTEAGGRLRLQWRADSGLMLDLAADAAYHGDDYPTGEARTNTQGSGPDANPGIYTVALDAPQRDDMRSSGLSGTVRWDHSLGALTSITALRTAQRRWAVDLDYSPADGSTLDYVDRYRRVSQELRLASADDTARLRWIGGLYLFRQTADSFRPVYAGNDIQMFVPPLSPGDSVVVIPNLETESMAVFGSVGYAVREDVRLDAGLRVVRLQRAIEYTQQSSAGYQSVGVLPVQDFRRTETEHAVLPDMTMSWDFADERMAYLRYARGSKNGGFDADILGAQRTEPSSFTEETADSYELGLKGAWYERRLNAGLSFFIAEYRDYQVSQFQPVGNNLVAPVVSNAGKVRSYGPELELQMRPMHGLSLRNSTAWLSSKYVDFRNGGGDGVDFSGNSTEFAPRWAINSALEYRWETAWSGLATATVDYAWRSRFYTQPSNQPAFEADIRRLLGARLAFADVVGNLELSLFGENLLDERYTETINRGALGTIYARYGASRSFGVQVQGRFQ